MIDHFIEFPEIGIRIEVSPVAFTVFGKEVYFYGIIIAAAFALALILAFKSAKRYNIDTNVFSDLIIVATPSAIICARLFYVVFEWKNYKDDLIQIFNLRSGGLAIYGVVIGVIISVLIYAKIKKIRIIRYFDFVAPYFVMAHAIGRFGNFVNQEAFGINTSLPWGMTGNLIAEELVRLRASGMDVNPAMNVHPTFLYEFIWNMLVFIILLQIRKRSVKDGRTVFAYMAFYGFGRMLIEGLRTDSLMLGSIRVNQMLGLVFFIVFGILFYMTSRKKKNIAETVSAAVPDTAGSPFSELAKKLREEPEGEDKESDRSE